MPENGEYVYPNYFEVLGLQVGPGVTEEAILKVRMSYKLAAWA